MPADGPEGVDFITQQIQEWPWTQFLENLWFLVQPRKAFSLWCTRQRRYVTVVGFTEITFIAGTTQSCSGSNNQYSYKFSCISDGEQFSWVKAEVSVWLMETRRWWSSICLQPKHLCGRSFELYCIWVKCIVFGVKRILWHFHFKVRTCWDVSRGRCVEHSPSDRSYALWD